MKVSVSELMLHAHQFLKSSFDLDLDIDIRLNGRLKKAMGRFVIEHRNGKTHDAYIEIAKDLLRYYPTNEIFDVLEHECVHYALWEQGKPYGDSDKEFIKTCNNLNVILTNTIKRKGKIHIFECGCGNVWKELLKYKDNRYYCGDCNKPLMYKETIVETE